MREAKLVRTESGLLPEGDGWFVVNARETRWGHTPDTGSYVWFEPDEPRFGELGVNVHVLRPGQPNSMYHDENAQEDFLVLSGECVLIVEGQERHLGAWDFAHCPAGTAHTFVGAGEGPCAILMVGARKPDDAAVYRVDETAQRYGASVAVETSSSQDAYAGHPPPVDGRYRDGDLPDL
jgi:uncharacterized cupin superfamily protein